MSVLDIAQQRNGKLRDGYSVNKAGASMEETRVEYGTAQGDSSGGFVEIMVDNSDESFEVACDSPISSGDRVAYISTNGNGKAVSVATLSKVASDASEIANATNQHFWTDTNGVHVSSDADNPNGAQNITMNANGVLLRKGANNLASFTPSSVNFYDSNGNAIATFGSIIRIKAIDDNGNYGYMKIDESGLFSLAQYVNGTFTPSSININASEPSLDITDADGFTQLTVCREDFEYNGKAIVASNYSLGDDAGLYVSTYYTTPENPQSGQSPYSATFEALPFFKVITFQHTTPSIANSSGSSGWLNITGVPKGYTAIGIVGVDSNHAYAWVSRTHKLDIPNKKIAYTYTNTSSTNQKCTFTFYLLCVPSANIR